MIQTFLSQSDFKRTVHHTDKLRVAAYIRVSTDEDDQENSFEVQKAYFEETLGRNHNWTSAGVFSDYGITGTQKKNRAGFNRMMRKCTEGKIDRILCKSISRLARNTADFIRTLDTLKKGIVLGDEIEYTTCFGLKLRSRGNSRTMRSFLGFRKLTEDGYRLLQYTWQLTGNTIQYRRKKKQRI